MTHATAKALLEKYFVGETSLSEETLLRDYFRAGDIHPDIRVYKDLFAYWDDAAKIKAPARRRSLPIRWLSAAAAAVLLLFAVNLWVAPNPEPELSELVITETKTVDWSKYEITDEKEAYQVLRAALKTASTSMNSSTKGLIHEVSEAAAMVR